MSAPTPGPWWATEPNGFGTVHIRADDGGATPAPIAEVLHFGPDGAEANARLIATAPRLLAALVALMDCGCTFGDCPAHDEARAAIAAVVVPA